MNDPQIHVRTLAAALVATGVLAVGGCSGTGTSSAPPSSDGAPSAGSSATSSVNDADVAFAQNMVMHHQQAIEMSDLLLAKDGVDEQVVQLAGRIKAAQTPEIEQMNTWLEEWGAEPMEDMGGMDHGDMDHGDMGGMMSEEDMAALEQAPGPEASSLFLEQMIEHHEGAIEMAEQQTDDGENPDAVALAGQITADQRGEIEEMRALLDTL